jgi:fructose 1,6-bisphosphatase
MCIKEVTCHTAFSSEVGGNDPNLTVIAIHCGKQDNSIVFHLNFAKPTSSFSTPLFSLFLALRILAEI